LEAYFVGTFQGVVAGTVGMVSEYVFDDDVFDAWVLRQRKPIAIENRRPGRVLKVDLETLDPYLVKPRYDGKNAFGHVNQCGSKAMYQHHIKYGEPIDEACRTARNAYDADLRRKLRARRREEKQNAEIRREGSYLP